MGSHWVLTLLYLKNVLYWPEDGRLRSKHVAIMWPECIYNITVLIHGCVLTEYNTLYKFVTTQRDGLCQIVHQSLCLWQLLVIQRRSHGTVGTQSLCTILWLHGAESFFRKWQILSWSRRSSCFMEPVGSQPCIQKARHFSLSWILYLIYFTWNIILKHFSKFSSTEKI